MSSSACSRVVLWLLALVSISKASIFRGGTVRWAPVYSTNDAHFNGTVLITHQVSWVWSSANGGMCNQTAVQHQTLLGGDEVLTCASGCTGDIGVMDYSCTDFNEPNWSNGERSYTYDSKGVDVFEGLFAGHSWVGLVDPEGSALWELRVRFNLTRRADTGRVNTSPTAAFFTEFQLLRRCNQTIQIPVIDYDNDVVRCRWAVGDECGDVCMSFPGDLDQDTCTIKYSGTGVQGFYVVAIQVEDFATADDTEPLSSVPVQFIVQVVDLGHSCDDHVLFVGDTPLHETCIAGTADQTLRKRVTARAIEGRSVTKILTVTPLWVRQSDPTGSKLKRSLLDPRESYMDIEWTPDASLVGYYFLCFSAQDNTGLSSSWNCITLLAGEVKVPVAVERPQELINQSNWSVLFDTAFVRPSFSAFIQVFEFAENVREVVSIDASLSDSVFYPESEDTPVLRFQTNFTVLEGSTYYVQLGSGVAVGSSGGCMTYSRPIFWPRVSIILPDPCMSDPCDVNADCTRQSLLNTLFNCSCRPPFEGSGVTCSIPDPCMSDPCDVNADCTRQSLLNTLFNCSCRQPFEGSGDTCSIPDPCLSGPCDINATCTREGLLSRRFECSCPEPFTGDGLTCSIPDPCLSDPCHSNASCVREGLRSVEFQCECDPGYQGDGLNCTELVSSSQVIVITVLSTAAIVVVFLLIGLMYGFLKAVIQIKNSSGKDKQDTLKNTTTTFALMRS